MRTVEEYNEYMRKYLLDKYYRRKQTAVEALGGKCARCGGIESLEFDHVDRSTKEYTLGHSFATLAETKLQAELLKCQLLCRECHILKTREDLGQQDARNSHGTISSYRYCKCDICRTANNEYMRDYFKRVPRKSRKKK